MQIPVSHLGIGRSAKVRRAAALLFGLALVAAACSPDADTSDSPSTTASPSTTTSTTTTVDVPAVADSPRENVASALDGRSDPSFPEPLIDLDRLRSGGPPPDGIPPLEFPDFVPVEDVDYLADQDPVLVLRIGDDARAYPVQILIWHEIVNDIVGNVPVSVTYCPLCNSAVAYDRRLDDRVLSFGTSGMLYNSALVMYDRQTESLWSHFTGQAVVGHLTGAQLDVHPVATVAWSDWRDANPDGLVLSRDTGFSRDYGRNPYPGYDDAGTVPFLFDGDPDGRLLAKQRVVGIERSGDAVAVDWDVLTAFGVMEVDLAGERLVLWHRPGAASALDERSLASGRDVGATGVFVPVADGRPLHFTVEDDLFVDLETGSSWNVFGEAVEGELAGVRLESVAHVDTFWFAWAAFLPETSIAP